MGVRLSVSEVVGGGCESRRDLYLKRVLKVRIDPSDGMKFGAYIHEVFRRSLAALRRLIEGGATKGWELIHEFDAGAVAAIARRSRRPNT